MVASVTGSESSTSSTKTAANKSMSTSYDMFLQLLTTQLKTQSPLNPADATQFTQQLATFAGLEQQVATNSKLDSVLSQFNALSISNGVAYIGKSVTASGNTVAVNADGKSDATLNYTLGNAAKEVKLSVVDSKGNVVWSGTGDPAQGTHQLTWDGKDSKGKTVPAGDYTLKVTATDDKDKAIETSTTITGKVTAVDSSSGSTVLEIGGTKVKLSAVTRLTP